MEMPIGRWLAGFMDQDHFRQKSGHMLLPQPENPVLERWEQARANLAVAPPALSNAAVRPIEDAFADHLLTVGGTDLFRAQTSGRNWSFAWVDIRETVALQESINLDYARAVAARISAVSGEREILDLCLPRDLRPQGQTYHITGASSHGVTIHSEDLNLIVMRANVEATESKDPGDPSVARLGFILGKAWHHVHVLSVGGRCYLKNGYHRAVGLAEAGVREMPCVVLHVDDLGAAECERWSHRLLTSERPPRVGDFLDPALTVDVPNKRVIKVIHATVQPLSRLDIQQFEIAMPEG
jgi:hypothetical protein